MNERSAGTRRQLEEDAAVEFPDVDPDALARAHEERWRQAAAQVPMPDEAREQLLGLLAGEGTTTPAAAPELRVSKWTARVWLERLRDEDLARVVGEKRGARWVLVVPGDGDSQ